MSNWCLQAVFYAKLLFVELVRLYMCSDCTLSFVRTIGSYFHILWLLLRGLTVTQLTSTVDRAVNHLLSG